MKKVFSLFLCLACFLSVGMLGGCSETDLSGVQSQIDELNATISALEDRLSAAEGNNTELQDRLSAAEGNNTELQSQLNQATAKLAALEGKINGETIEYLNLGDTASFVSNGIKLFDIQVMKGIQRAKVSTVDFNLDSPLTSDDLTNFLNITAYIYDPNTDKFEQNYNEIRKNSIIDNIDYFAEYSAVFYPNEETSYLGYFFSGTTLVAAYQINFVRI